MKNLLSLLFVIFSFFQINAQDALLHQFQNSPVYLSPTFSGTACNSRLVLNYQNQWSSILKENAYSTASFSFDMPLELGNGDKFGLGVRYFSDKAGEASFETQQASFILNYQKQILIDKESKHFLIGGFDIGLGHRKIDFLNLRYGSQHNGMGGFDPTLPPNEVFDRDNFRYFDLSVGLAWRSEFLNDSKVHLGMNLHHINEVNLSFSEDEFERGNIRYSFFGMYDIALIKKFYFSPRIVYNIQGPVNALLLGGDVSYLLGKEANHRVSLGTTFRTTTSGIFGIDRANAQMLNVAYSMKKFTLGFNYVFDQSAINTATGGAGGFDLAVIYRFCK